MASIDLSRVQFWQPPLNLSSSKQRPASLHIRKNTRPSLTDSSRNQLASLPNEALRHDNRAKSAVAATRPQERDLTQHEVNAVGAQGRDNANRNDEADDDLPSIEEFWSQMSRQGIATGHQNSKDTLQHLEKSALDTNGSRPGPMQSRLDNGIGGSRGTPDKPVILEDDEVDTWSLKATAVSASAGAGINPSFEPSELLDPPSHGPWWDVEDSCFVDADICPSLPGHDRLLSQLTLPQDQPYSDHNDETTGGALDEQAPYSLLTLLDESGGGGTDENTSELERGIQLALEEQGPSLVLTPSSFCPRRDSAELSHSQVGGVEIPHSDPQNLVEVVDADNPKNKEATETLSVKQLEMPEIDEYCFRLREIRTQQFAGRQTETTQYRIVWGEHPNQSNSWVNEDDIQLSMPWPVGDQDLIPQIETNVRVHQIRCSRHSKNKKLFEYMVDGLSTWITEDQLRISFSSTLLANLKESLPDPFSQTQYDVNHKRSVSSINNEHCHSLVSRSPGPCVPSSPATSSQPEPEKRGEKRKRKRLDTHTEINSDVSPSVIIDDNYAIRNGDPRPAKRQRPRLAPTVTAPLHVRRSPRLMSLPTTSLEVDAQPQADRRCRPTPIHNKHSSRTSRSPSKASKAAAAAEYQEWPFQGFLKRVTIGNQTIYNLEFSLPRISEHLNLSLHSEDSSVSAKESSIDAAISRRAVTSRKPGKELTKDQESLLAKMVQDDQTWTEIGRHFPGYTLQWLKKNFFTKQGGKPRKRGRKPGVKGRVV
ncbi:hypothetical protein LARI1_G009055 [Lachnellula arida]|uniref:Uncharacterized protein n=1 Tax=Lachnellula arida TaxID=1316785 RepID=A0A8T9B153_9HELO|nr:hypothetical protein LARI1_G009055 [Lachnellula arida]